MKHILKKILLGNIAKPQGPHISPLRRSISNISSIWHNEHHDDQGLEKIIRLVLSSSQLLFPGIYIKTLADRKGYEYQSLATDLYICMKVLFPFIILVNHWQSYMVVVGLMVYTLLETILYIPTLIFASDLLSKPRSYRRSMLLLFFNYVEIILAYAVLYASGNHLNRPFDHWLDPVYFSTITSTSVGYGDFYPVTVTGKMLVSSQALLFLFFVVLFLNFFSARIKTKGYFDHEN